MTFDALDIIELIASLLIAGAVVHVFDVLGKSRQKTRVK